jgi:hypothetical protein
LKTEVASLTPMQDIGIDARAIVTDAEAEILRIRELNSQL